MHTHYLYTIYIKYVYVIYLNVCLNAQTREVERGQLHQGKGIGGGKLKQYRIFHPLFCLLRTNWFQNS